MAVVRHLGLKKICSICSVALIDIPFCFLVQNFAEIGQSVDELWPKNRSLNLPVTTTSGSCGGFVIGPVCVYVCLSSWLHSNLAL